MTRIPLPGNMIDSLLNGVRTGSAMYSGIMNPILNRENQQVTRDRNKELAQQFGITNQRQAEQFAQEMALRKQAESRMGANTGLQRELLNQKINNLKNPMAALKQKLDYISQLEAKQNVGNLQQPINQDQNMMGLNNNGEQALHQGQGMMANQSPLPQENTHKMLNGVDLEDIKRGLTLQALGIKNNDHVLHGAARDASDLERLKNQVGEGSPVYQNAKAQYEAQLDAKKDLRDLRARTKSGLKAGEKEFFDEKTGEPLGKEIPLTAKERESEEGNILFNELYPIVYKGAFPFSGEGSITRLEKAAQNYKTDPKARKLFDDFLLSEKTMAATTVNEASTLKSGHTNQTYNRLKESLEVQDIPKLVKKFIKEYKIPPEASLKAAMRYQKALSDARKKARSGTPATQKLFYNPELQNKYDSEKDMGSSMGAKVINGVTYYPDGQGGWEHD